MSYIVVLRVLDVIGGDMAAIIESEEKEQCGSHCHIAGSCESLVIISS